MKNGLSCAFVAAFLLAACGGGGGDASPDPIRPGPDPLPNGVLASADTQVAANCNGGNASGTLYANAEVEPMLSAAPSNASLLLGAWQQDRASNGGARALVTASSSDGGRSWVRTLHPMSRCGLASPGSVGDVERASDPWVDIGPDGTAYLMGLAFNGAALTNGASSAMLVSRSADGGRSWAAPVSLQRDGDAFFNDKNTLTADPTDARWVYAVWDRLDRAGNGPTLLARSSNSGLSWEPTRLVYAPGINGGVSQTIGNRIVVLTQGPQRGMLINAFVQVDSIGNQSTASVRVMRSADKGLTWDSPITVAEHRSVGTRDPDNPATTVRDGGIIPVVASGAGARIWLAWQDARFSGGLRDAIALARSDDGGLTWSTPVAVNAAPGVPAFLPSLHVRSDGQLGLMYFDLRSNTADTTTLLADVWLAVTRDGMNFSETALLRGFNLATAPQVTGGLFIGDYQGLTSQGSTWLPLLALPRSDPNNRTEVFALRVEASAAASAANQRPHAARGAAPSAGSGDETAFGQATSAAITSAMQRRVPGWGRWAVR